MKVIFGIVNIRRVFFGKLVYSPLKHVRMGYVLNSIDFLIQTLILFGKKGNMHLHFLSEVSIDSFVVFH